jgi:hypothetical protein
MITRNIFAEAAARVALSNRTSAIWLSPSVVGEHQIPSGDRRGLDGQHILILPSHALLVQLT